MAYKDLFTYEQWGLLIALPYRVGYWISQSDVTGGAEAQDAEMKTLETLLTSFAEDILKTEFFEEIIKETLAEKDKWTAWQDNAENVPAECEKALSIIEAHVEQKDVASFKQNLAYIAGSVARAYCEVEDQTALGFKIMVYKRYLFGRLMAALGRGTPPSLSDIMSISPSERQALSALANALSLDNDIYTQDPANLLMTA